MIDYLTAEETLSARLPLSFENYNENVKLARQQSQPTIYAERPFDILPGQSRKIKRLSRSAGPPMDWLWLTGSVKLSTRGIR